MAFSIRKGLFRGITKKVIPFAIFLALSTNVYAQGNQKFVQKLTKILPNYELIIEKERVRGDGLIYIPFNYIDEDFLAHMITKPELIKFTYSEGDTAFNTIKDFIKSGPKNEIALEIDLRLGKVTRIFDSKGKELFPEIFSKKIEILVPKSKLKNHIGAYVLRYTINHQVKGKGVLYYVYSTKEIASLYLNRDLELVKITNKSLIKLTTDLDYYEQFITGGRTPLTDVLESKTKWRFNNVLLKSINDYEGYYIVRGNLGNLINEYPNWVKLFMNKKDAIRYLKFLMGHTNMKLRVDKLTPKLTAELFYRYVPQK